MVSSLDGFHALVEKMKEKLLRFDNIVDDPCYFVSPSAYDTAWLAMICDPNEKSKKPLFKGCLDWVLNNQKKQGFWGEIDCHGNATIDSLPNTLACMVALKMWDVRHDLIEKGMEFIRANSTKLLEGKENDDHEFPRWFTIVFPGMVELAWRKGIQVVFADQIKQVVTNVFRRRDLILTTENILEKSNYPPLVSYLEALPQSYQIDKATILNNLDGNGSLFQSPSATSAAFMATQSPKIFSYLNRLRLACTHGVPLMYPVDDHWIKLCLVNHLERLGLSEHFSDEIKKILDHIYWYFNANEQSDHTLAPANLFKDSLAFELLRLKGYEVSPWKLCWFLEDENARTHIEKNYEKFSCALYGLYRASNLMFQGETTLQDLKSFLRPLLMKISRQSSTMYDDILMWPNLQELINYEISVPWLARLDRLDHRRWIEANEKRPLWLGKASYYRMSFLDNLDLLQVAKENYENQQEIYRIELEELRRWSKAWGFTDMGFAREKTTFCYFAIASSMSLPYDSEVRLIVTKIAVLVTVIDDFFDTEASLDELRILTKAVQRWDNEGLTSHSKTLFDALDNFVTEIAKKYLNQHRIEIIHHLRHIWLETFASWLMEATWSQTGQIPPMATYLETGMISVAAHTIVLQASCFLKPSLRPHNLSSSHYEATTEFLMTSCRLLNDLQSYEKEEKDGKFNSVSLYMKENPNANLEGAIQFVQSILDEAKMKLLEHALMMDGFDDLPRPCKKLHLSCLKVFQMFFNSGNHFDSEDSLVQDINKAIYQPFILDSSKSTKVLPLHSTKEDGINNVIEDCCTNNPLKYLQSMALCTEKLV